MAVTVQPAEAVTAGMVETDPAVEVEVAKGVTDQRGTETVAAMGQNLDDDKSMEL